MKEINTKIKTEDLIKEQEKEQEKQLEKQLEKQVEQYIVQHHLIGFGDLVLAGVSGGADSMCLLELLHACMEQIGFELRVIHVEHGIRGSESVADAQYVGSYCAARAIPCEIITVDAGAYARAHGYSIEEAARELRYTVFEAAAQKLESPEPEQADVAAARTVRIAVAHHREDQAETVLWQMIRGSDLRGIGGIRPQRGRVIRPLLEVSRVQIEAYLTQRQIGWREDVTNADTAYTRNRLRHEVIPVLEQLNTQAVRHLCESAQRAQEAEEYLAAQTEEVYRRVVSQRTDGVLLVSEKLRQEAVLLQRRVMYRALETCAGRARDLQAKHMAALLDLFGHQVGQRLMLPYGIDAWRDYEGISFMHRQVMPETPAHSGQLPDGISMELIDCGPGSVHGLRGIEISKKKYTKCFDYDKIEHHVQIRRRQDGDYLTIDAEGHRQKLKNYLVNEKIPRQERGQLWLLADGSHIMWVIGHRISDYYKVDTHTRRILKVQYSGGKEDE